MFNIQHFKISEVQNLKTSKTQNLKIFEFWYFEILNFYNSGAALGIGASKDRAESPTALPERPKKD